MQTIKEAASAFLANKRVAVTGVSRTPKTHGSNVVYRRLRERGYGVVVISHNLADVFEVADRIYVLRLGQEAGDFKAGEVSQDKVVAAITGSAGNGGGQR